VLIADMKAARQLTAPGDDLERLLYGFSLLICLSDSMSSPGSTATGTVLRPGTVRDYAIRADADLVYGSRQGKLAAQESGYEPDQSLCVLRER
jgi:hypothetical protein